MPRPDAQPSRRYHSLDGLRGVAALSVVGYHMLLVVPTISALYVANAEPSAFSPEWWLFRTPLRLLTPGPEAVLIFFALSGFVLTLPLLRSPMTLRSTAAYYGRRMLRLYVPVWGAIVFALILAALVPRHPGIGSSWLSSHKPPTISALAHDVTLLLGTSNLDSPLWSLGWEVWFSLLLPVLFLLIKVARVHDWWIPAILLLAAISVGAQFHAVAATLPSGWLASHLLQYLPVFGIGMILAGRRETLAALGARVRHWWIVAVVGLLLLVSPTVFVTNHAGYLPVDAVLGFASLLGVTAVVFLALEAPAARAFFEARPSQWLGKRSFSIYLVHEPIIVATALLVRADGWLPWILISVALLPVILLVAEGFYRLVEFPAHRLAQAVGQRILRTPTPVRSTV
jgi:peptidoglycan/LPS O-acetylase OafA/YrhL